MIKFNQNQKIALKSDTSIKGAIYYLHPDFSAPSHYLYEVIWDKYKDHKPIYLPEMLVAAP